jgi:hypothetical protein
MTAEVHPSEKFAVISFDRDKCKDMPSTTFQLAENCWCTATLPFELDKSWVADLGSLTCDTIRKSQFFIFTKCHTKTPQILDEEMNTLEQEALHIRWGLLLLGMPRSYVQHLMSGANEGHGPRMRSHSELNMLREISGQAELVIKPDLLQRAYALGQKRRMLYIHGDKYKRIKRGLHALFRSFEEDEMGSRFHDLVRAVEAVIYPKKGKTKKDFVNHCRAITNGTNTDDQVLREIYDMRSAVEHMHHHFDGVGHYPESQRETVAFLRLRQLDTLARFIYIQILESTTLINMFETDGTIQELWNAENAQQFWKTNLDLLAEQAGVEQNLRSDFSAL